jgi:hypothetical protein
LAAPDEGSPKFQFHEVSPADVKKKETVWPGAGQTGTKLKDAPGLAVGVGGSVGVRV